jgi:hypothetical protein
MKTYGGVDVKTHVFFTSTLDEGEWYASRSCRFTSRTHWIGHWVDLKACLYDMEKLNFLALPGFELRTLSHSANRYTGCALDREADHECMT